ncbi:MAG: mycothiol synthase [Actinomycetales bacterium]
MHNGGREGDMRGVDAATDEDLAELPAVISAARAADGVDPWSEHARLHAARGGGTNLVVRIGPRTAGFAHLDLEDGAGTGEVVVDPGLRRRGVGTALLRGLAEAAAPAGLRVWAHGRLPAAEALAARLEMAEVRELRQLHRALTGPDVEQPPDAGLPQQFRLRPFRVGEDEQAWLQVNARAFAGHPEQGRWTIEDLRDREGTDWFDPDGFLLAEVVAEPGRLAGFHWTKQHARPGGPPLGEVYVVGLDPAYQGHGLGSVMTLAGLRYLRSRGLDEVILYVDGDNAAAIATYARLGFTTSLVDVMYAWPRA